jgi:hypothetical protein
MNERWTMNRNYERTMNDRMIERTNDRNFGIITAGKRLFWRTNGRTIGRTDERTMNDRTNDRMIGQTIEWSDERTNKLRTRGRTIEERPNDPCASVCLCGRWSGCVWGERVAMKWLGVGWEEALAPLFIAMVGEIRGDVRISGRMRGLGGD